MSLDKSEVIGAFIDLRSPYSYLALKPVRDLADRYDKVLRWWPYITDFQSAYGGEIAQRAPRDVAKLKYLYMDCRRLAAAQGLTIRATTKLWDVELGSKAFLFARNHGKLWEFLDPMLAAFWRREFDLECQVSITEKLVAAGLDERDWLNYLAAEAESELKEALAQAEARGVFGAPTFVYEDEVFWGGDRLAMLESRFR